MSVCKKAECTGYCESNKNHFGGAMIHSKYVSTLLNGCGDQLKRTSHDIILGAVSLRMDMYAGLILHV